ncbi:hypothetical protein AJ78_05534 [Emergomyces pasteurianus Ep9510]|uniref:Uncharacterized protein n=1 Tax=Emergomyces pasteurianus Ep9510 TaxID=1447872 RepID=A0A1J9PC35_9EURO|nr:hypothetical protein AJ78_05534 [Emergomyces pasteurianus Ep9510]
MASQATSQVPQTGPKPLTAKDLTEKILPDLNVKKSFFTTALALHKIHFTGKLQKWDSFESEVTSFIPQVKWNQKILCYHSTHPGHRDINGTEHFRCGDESSVSGRFISHVLHVMSAIGKEAGFTSVFGDWRATVEARKRTGAGQENRDNSRMARGKIIIGEDEPGEGENSDSEDDKEGDEVISKKPKRLVPDYALLTEAKCEVRLAGEAKSPWKHGIKSWCDKFEVGGSDGQIAQYMQVFHLKYGFLTTYENTILLKQAGTKTDAVLLEQTKDFEENSTPWLFVNDVGKDRSGIQWIVKHREDNESSTEYGNRVRRALQHVAGFQNEQGLGIYDSDSQSAGGISSAFEKMAIGPQDDDDDGRRRQKKPSRTPKVGSRSGRFADPLEAPEEQKPPKRSSRKR